MVSRELERLDLQRARPGERETASSVNAISGVVVAGRPTHLPTYPPTHPPTHLPTCPPTHPPTHLVRALVLFVHRDHALLERLLVSEQLKTRSETRSEEMAQLLEPSRRWKAGAEEK